MYYYYNPNIIFSSLSSVTYKIMGNILKDIFKDDIEFIRPITCYDIDIKDFINETEFSKYDKFTEKFKPVKKDKFSLYFYNLFSFCHEIVDKQVRYINKEKDIIIVTITSILQLNHLIHLLINRYKCVIGGSCINFYGEHLIRSILSKFDIQNCNYIIISGNLNSENKGLFYSVIKEWKSYDIGGEVNLDDLYSEYDYLYDSKFFTEKENQILYRSLPLLLEDGCQYRSCKYCYNQSISKRSYVNLIKNKSNNIIEKINMNLEKYKKYNLDKSVSLCSNHISKNDINILLDENIKFERLMYFMIHPDFFLHDSSFLNLVNLFKRYGNKDIFYLVGIESFSDVSLRYVGRNYNIDNILEVLSKIKVLKDYCSKEYFVEATLINDLPIDNLENILQTKEILYRLKDEFSSLLVFHFNFLRVTEFSRIPKIAALYNNEYIHPEYLCGYHALLKDILKSDIYKQNYLLTYNIIPLFVRIDSSGRLIKSDRILFFTPEK